MTPMILHGKFVLPMTSGNPLIEDGAVLVGADGRIEQVGDARTILSSHPGIQVKHCDNTVLMPGLVNTHAHSGLLRGTAEGLPVWDWLEQFIDPMHRVLQPHEAAVASQLCYAEALLSGTTTIVDMWRFMEGSARAAEQLGIRAVMVPYVGEHPDHNYFETLDTNEALIDAWHGRGDGRISVWVGLEHMFYATPDAWARAVAISRKHRVGLHTHSNESQFDVTETQRRYGMRPLQALEHFGLLDAERVLLAHCVWVDDDEIEVLARRRVGVAHCPTSNMKLASGAAPVAKLLARGIAVGLGTDGEKENNNLDMFEEMKVASLLAKFTRLDASAMDSWDVCRMATVTGARALGMEDAIGTLEVGKQADIIAVRTDTPRMTPIVTGRLANLHHNLVFAVQGGDVRMTMVAGRIVVDEGRLLTGDLTTFIAEANVAVPGLFQRREAWLQRHRSVNALRSASES